MYVKTQQITYLSQMTIKIILGQLYTYFILERRFNILTYADKEEVKRMLYKNEMRYTACADPDLFFQRDTRNIWGHIIFSVVLL